MKNLILISSLLALTACQSSGGGSASPEVATSTNVPVATPSPTPSPSPSPTPSPTPSGWGGFSGGGVMSNPYQVVTATDVTHIQDYPSAYFELVNSIDMTGTSFTPITDFSGVIQGHLFKLENLTIAGSGSTDVAFAMTLSGSINQLYMSGISITSAAGYAAAYAYSLTGHLTNCQILSGTVTSPRGGSNPFFVGSGGGAGGWSALQSTVDYNGTTSFQTF